MALKSFAAIGRTAADGMHWQYIYKAATPVPGTAGYFVDLNQSSGIPKYNPFVGSELTATQLIGDGNNGIYEGNFEPGKSKYLLRWQMTQITASATPDLCYLCDYLLFYTLIDCDNLDTQNTVNTVGLPRYAAGEGVRIVLVATSPLVSTAPMTISYTNSAGVSSRSVTFNIIPAAAIGVCASGMGTTGGAGQASPFVPLADGDTGVRSIDSITMGGSGGGFVCACLVKPLATLPIYEVNVASEKTFGFQSQALPEIREGAYLNLLIQRGAAVAGNYRGEMLFINA